MNFMIGTKEDSKPKESKPTPKGDEIFFMTAKEATDPKNASKRAHRSLSPKYKEGILVGYTVGGYTPSYIKYLEAEKLKKKQAN